jgi:feruloyl esterase
MTVKSKVIITAFYGTAPKFSYWSGCSLGGNQALKEAQRFPEDFDGIIAGAPVNYLTHLNAAQIYPTVWMHQIEGGAIPVAKFPMIHEAVLKACDALDGVKDGLIENPDQCHFDPEELECKGEDNPACLTAPQVQVLRKMYEGPVNPRTGEQIFPGLARVSESGFAGYAGAQPFSVALGLYQ